MSICFLALVSGCSGNSGKGVAVSGNVTLDGNPLANGMIMFLPKQHSEGLRTFSATVTDGIFSISPASNFMPGSYKIILTSQKKTGKKISAEEGSTEMEDEYAQFLPAKYNTKTTLTAEITQNTKPLEFKLSME